MAAKYGKCTNIGNCNNADTKKILEIPDIQSFTCPECECELFETKNIRTASSSSKSPILIILIFIFLLIGGGIYFATQNFSSTGKGDSGEVNKVSDNKSIPEKPVPETSPEKPINKDISDEYLAIKERSEVRIGVQADSPPLNYYEKGRPTGLDFEVAKLIFAQSEFGFNDKHSINVENEVEGYKEIPKLLSQKDQNGKYVVDIIMGGLTFSNSDDPNIIYTIPYLEHFGYSLVSKSKDSINSLRDLRNKKIGIIKGDPDVAAYIQGILPDGATLIELSDESETWTTDSIDGNLCDAIVYDFPFAAVEIEGTDLKIKVAKLPNSDIGYKIGLRKGNEVLRDKLNSAIHKVKDMPEYPELLKKYLPTGNVVVPKNAGKNPTHRVKKGETLSLIAKEHLNNIDRWDEIQSLNNIPNPHLISIDQILIMPNDYH